MYEAMERAYHEGNARANQENKEKVYNYSLLNQDFVAIQSGKCKNVSYRYDPRYDFNIITFTDIETEKRYSVCQFYVKMKEIKE